jgi:hypothetical protein
MSDEMQEMRELLEEIDRVLDAAQENDLDTIYEHLAQRPAGRGGVG